MTTCEISNEDYEKIVIIWKTFRRKQKIRDYCDLYLNINVLLLAIVLKIIKVESTNSFGIDPAHYLSTPGYSWDVMLRFTDANLKVSIHSKFDKRDIFEWFAKVIPKITINS